MEARGRNRIISSRLEEIDLLKSLLVVLGVAVLDHPGNPYSTWHNSRTLWMLNPNIAATGPYTIKPDAPLTLRYRVVVHDGPTPTAIVQKLSDEWRAMK
jgi:hypothetical protein